MIVEQDWWRYAFDEVYLETDGDVVENPQATEAEVSLVWDTLRLREKSRVLDVCCGQGRHAIALATRGCHVTGVDYSDYLLSIARARSVPGVFFHQQDVRSLPYVAEFDAAILLGNSFGYFDNEEDDMTVLRGCVRALRKGGLLGIDLTDGDYFKSHFEPTSIENTGRCQVTRTRAMVGDRIVTREVVTGAIKADRVYAERLYSANQVRRLFADVGMCVVAEIPVHGTSSWGGDVGLMGHRTLFVGSMLEDAQ